MQKTVSLRHEFVCLLIFITILRAHPLYELQIPPAITKYSPSGTTRLLPSLHVFVSSIQQVVLKLSTIIYAAKKRPYKRGVVITSFLPIILLRGIQAEGSAVVVNPTIRSICLLQTALIVRPGRKIYTRIQQFCIPSTR